MLYSRILRYARQFHVILKFLVSHIRCYNQGFSVTIKVFGVTIKVFGVTIKVFGVTIKVLVLQSRFL